MQWDDNHNQPTTDLATYPAHYFEGNRIMRELDENKVKAILQEHCIRLLTDGSKYVTIREYYGINVNDFADLRAVVDYWKMRLQDNRLVDNVYI
jgi:hypothetical protein